MTNDQAQKALEREVALRTSWQEAQKADVERKGQAWAKEMEADKELGGDNLKATCEGAKRALKAVAPPEVVKFLEDSKLGNNKHVIKMFHSIWQRMKPDSFVQAGAQLTESAKRPEDVLFPMEEIQPSRQEGNE